MTVPTRPLSTGIAFLYALTLTACGESPTDSVDDPLLQIVAQDDIVFMTQSRTPAVSPDALHVGTIGLGADGCLRLEGPEDHTVIWPVGFEFRRDGERITIIDANGDERGDLDSEFRLGGGEVSELHEGMGFTPQDRARATENCPGKYWVAHSVQ